MNGMIQGNPDVRYVGQDAVHERLELVAPMSAPPVIGKEHAVFFGQVFLENVDLGLAQADTLLAGHVDNRWAFSNGKIAQLYDLAGLGTLGDLVLGPEVVLHEHVQIGIDSLIPIPAVVFQPDKAHLAPVRPAGKPCAGTLPVTNGIGVLGDLHQLELDLFDRRNLGDYLAEWVENDLLLDHLLDLDHGLVGFLLPSPGGHLIQFLATR